MRILTLSNFYPPEHLGGYEQLCAEVMDGLGRRGHQVCVLTTRRRATGEAVVDDGVARVLYPEVDLRPYRAAAAFFYGRQRRRRHNLSALRALRDRFSPDICFVWGMWNLGADLVAEMESWRHPPLAFYLADYWPSLPDAYTLYWREPAKRRLTGVVKRLLAGLGGASRTESSMVGRGLKLGNVACVSAAVRRRLRECGFALRDAAIIYNGIDFDQFKIERTPVGVSGDAAPLAILYAGRITPEKGVHLVIEALERNNQQGGKAKFTAIGWGDERYAVDLRHRAECAGVADRLTLLPPVAREQMPSVLSRFDVLVAPSTWPEPMPRIIQEAMASGMVVVAADVGGVNEIVQHEANGFLFAAGDAAALADRLLQIERTPESRSAIAAAARETVRARFSLGRMIDEVDAYLSKVVSNGP